MTRIRDGGARHLGGAATAGSSPGRSSDGKRMGEAQDDIASQGGATSRDSGERDRVESSGPERCGAAAPGKRRGRGRTDL
jgi:hypothetical protein